MENQNNMQIKMLPAYGTTPNPLPMSYDPIYILAHIYNEPDIDYLQNINIQMKNEILKDLMGYLKGILNTEEMSDLEPLFLRLYSEVSQDLEADFKILNKNILKIEDSILVKGKVNMKKTQAKKISAPKPTNVPKPGMTSTKKKKLQYDLIEQSLKLMRRPLAPTPH